MMDAPPSATAAENTFDQRWESHNDDNDNAPSGDDDELGDNAPPGLGRHLGLWSSTFLVIGRIIGTGIFSVPGFVLVELGSGGAMLLWLIGLCLAFCGQLVWMELGCMLPRSGGTKVYLEAAFPSPTSLMTILFAFHAVFLGFTAGACIGFAENVLASVGLPAGNWAERGIAVAAIVAVTFVHAFFPRVGLHGQSALTVLKIGVLVFIGVTGLVVLGGEAKTVPSPHKIEFGREPGVDRAGSGYFYATALLKVMNSYSGWSNLCNVLNEVKNPVRTLKLSGFLGLSTCGLLYLLANLAYFVVTLPSQIVEGGTTVASHFMVLVFGDVAQQAISVLVGLSALGSVMAITYSQSRVNQELAKEGILPLSHFWASSWPCGSPAAGLLLHMLATIILIVAIPFGDAYSFILDLDGYPDSIVNLMVAIGLLQLRITQPHLKRPFCAPLAVAAVFIATQLFLIMAPVMKPLDANKDKTAKLPSWLYPLLGTAILGCGLLYWFLWWVMLPKLGKYRLVPRKERLQDGTVMTRYEARRSSGEVGVVAE